MLRVQEGGCTTDAMCAEQVKIREGGRKDMAKDTDTDTDKDKDRVYPANGTEHSLTGGPVGGAYGRDM